MFRSQRHKFKPKLNYIAKNKFKPKLIYNAKNTQKQSESNSGWTSDNALFAPINTWTLEYWTKTSNLTREWEMQPLSIPITSSIWRNVRISETGNTKNVVHLPTCWQLTSKKCNHVARPRSKMMPMKSENSRIWRNLIYSPGRIEVRPELWSNPVELLRYEEKRMRKGCRYCGLKGTAWPKSFDSLLLLVHSHALTS